MLPKYREAGINIVPVYQPALKEQDGLLGNLGGFSDVVGWAALVAARMISDSDCQGHALVVTVPPAKVFGDRAIEDIGKCGDAKVTTLDPTLGRGTPPGWPRPSSCATSRDCRSSRTAAGCRRASTSRAISSTRRRLGVPYPEGYQDQFKALWLVS
jgi:hypothetical protein